MLTAAFTSRSKTVEQLLQVHSRSFRVNSLLIEPHTLQVFDEGANLPIRSIFLPYQSALYSNIETKVDQLASLIACARLWFFIMFFTARVSKAIVWFSRISFVEVLCKKSLRLFTTFSCSKASRFLVFLPLFFEYLRCTYFNLDCALRRYLGFSISSPSEVTKNVLIPKSRPIAVVSFIGTLVGFSIWVSTNIEAKYLPVGVLLITALFIVPLILRWITTLIPFFLNLGIIKKPFSTITFCGTENDCLPRCLDLNFGNPAPLKNFLKAISIFWIDCCKLCEFISFNQGHSFFNSGSCFIKSKAEKLCLVPKYAVFFVSKARLYTNRLLPICLAINSFCEFVGYNLYLYDLNIRANLHKNTELSKKMLNLQNVSVKRVACNPSTKDEWVLRSIYKNKS